MKNIFLITLAAMFFCSCHKNGDLDLLPGTFQTFSPISVNGIELNNDYWRLTNDSLIISRFDSVIHSERISWHEGRLNLFVGSNPYYEKSLTGGQINTIWWGFYYQCAGLPKFTLQRIN